MFAPRVATSVVLPSIHEMFPDHILRRPHHRLDSVVDSAQHPTKRQRYSSPSPPPPPPLQRAYHLAIFQSDPNVGSSAAPVGRTRARSASFPTSADSQSDGDDDRKSLNESTNPSKEDLDAGRAEQKKHICAICKKRFNRPSSLRIHVNTHTGAMPFRCPQPGCGRMFNVNSNMRRHFRNHNNGATESHCSPPTPHFKTSGNDPAPVTTRGSPGPSAASLSPGSSSSTSSPSPQTPHSSIRLASLSPPPSPGQIYLKPVAAWDAAYSLTALRGAEPEIISTPRC